MRYLISLCFALCLALGSTSVAQAAVVGGGQQFGPTNVTANNTDFFTFDAIKLTAVVVQVSSVGGGATISWQGSNDVAFGASIALQGIPSAGGTAVTSTTAVGHWVVPVTTRYIRVRTTAYTSGTITVSTTGVERASPVNHVNIIGGSLGANQSTNIAQINGVTPLMGNGVTGTGALRVSLASDTSTNTNPLLVGGTGTTSIGKAEDAVAASGDTGVFALGIRRDSLVVSANANGDYNEEVTDRFGSLQVRGFEKSARTYRGASNVTVVATPTDVWDLFGNATTTVVVTRLKITGIQTTTGTPEMLVVKRSTANTAGTRVAQTAVPLDSTDAAASSTPGAYTANPTTGTLVGAVARSYVIIPTAAAPVGGAGYEFQFGDKGKGLLLSGTAQGLALNLNGVTLTGGVLNIEVEWYEY